MKSLFLKFPAFLTAALALIIAAILLIFDVRIYINVLIAMAVLGLIYFLYRLVETVASRIKGKPTSPVLFLLLDAVLTGFVVMNSTMLLHGIFALYVTAADPCKGGEQTTGIEVCLSRDLGSGSIFIVKEHSSVVPQITFDERLEFWATEQKLNGANSMLINCPQRESRYLKSRTYLTTAVCEG